MKRLILIFCADGTLARSLAESLRTDDTTTQMRDAVSFDGIVEHCDNVIIMPDVTGWRREKLERAYDGFVLESDPQPVAGDGGAPGKTVKHKGFGRWFVMDGETEISGPHTKEEAEGLAA